MSAGLGFHTTTTYVVTWKSQSMIFLFNVGAIFREYNRNVVFELDKEARLTCLYV